MIESSLVGAFSPPSADADPSEHVRAEEAEHALIAEHAARREAEISAERFRFLSEAGALLASALDEDAVVANLAHLGVAMLADWCAVELVDIAGGVRRVAAATVDSHVESGVLERDAIRHRELITRVIDSGRTVLWSEPGQWTTAGPLLCVPLIAQGRCLGAVLFVARPTATYGASELALAEELVRHAASALTNARLYDEQLRLRESLVLSEKMSAIGTVAAGVAHEARNPLFGISSTVDALESTFPTRAELQPFIERLRQEVDRLGRLMSDLLQYGKPSLFERGSVALVDVLTRAIAHCEPMAARADVVVHADFYRVAIPNVLLERERMVRVFQNLLENAIEHSGKGSVVRVSASVGYASAAAWVEVRVSDRGPGFSAADLPRVFEPFFTTRHRGTGLGLSIVERIVREHGGTVAAANGREGGAVVTVRLPVVSASNGR